MDLAPLRRLWRGRRHGEPSPALRAALADLDRLIVERPELAGPGRSLSELLRAAFHPPVSPPPAWSGPEVIHEAWGAGVPAFRASPPPLDGTALRSRGLALCSALSADNPRSSSLRAAIRRREVDLRAWWDEVLAGRPESVDRQAEALSIDPALALSVLRLALLPDLAAFSGVLAPLLHEGPGTEAIVPIAAARPSWPSRADWKAVASCAAASARPDGPATASAARPAARTTAAPSAPPTWKMKEIASAWPAARAAASR